MAVKNVSQPFELPIDAAGVHVDMDVYSRNGEQLGVVSEVWADIQSFGYLPKSRFALADYGPVRGTMHLLDGADGYIQVSPRRGMQRENEPNLFIPLDAIHDTVPGQTLITAYTKEESLHVFGQRPACLDGSR